MLSTHIFLPIFPPTYKRSQSVFPKEYALPTSDLKARPIVGVGVRAIIRGQLFSAELNDLLSLHCIKTIGSPAYSDELTSVPCHVCVGEDFRAFRQVIG